MCFDIDKRAERVPITYYGLGPSLQYVIIPLLSHIGYLYIMDRCELFRRLFEVFGKVDYPPRMNR